MAMRTRHPIRVLIADSQELFRRGLFALFDDHTEFNVVGETGDGMALIDLCNELKVDVAVMDILLPRLDGISACRRIRQIREQTEILFLTDVHNEKRMREAFEAGARAYLIKTCGFDELAFAVTKAAAGDYYVSGAAGQDMVADYVKPLLESKQSGGIMTQRERELAKLLADGYSTKECADILNISPKTAETHRASIMKKLNARNVTDIVKYCIRNHLIQP
ncbi:response regulator [candidate division GN15 bacterium]|nr:response regulator [candidate division GN15 bacterium]